MSGLLDGRFRNRKAGYLSLGVGTIIGLLIGDDLAARHCLWRIKQLETPLSKRELGYWDLRRLEEIMINYMRNPASVQLVDEETFVNYELEQQNEPQQEQEWSTSEEIDLQHPAETYKRSTRGDERRQNSIFSSPTVDQQTQPKSSKPKKTNQWGDIIDDDDDDIN
jgi:hypothetical protein